MFTTYTIGRSATMDYVIDHESVSRLHAEATRSSQNRLFIIDCGSSWGTFVWRNEQWQPLQQGYVTQDDLVAFGKQKLPVATLLSFIDRNKAKPEYPPENDAYEPLSVKPRRNATTGEIKKS